VARPGSAGTLHLTAAVSPRTLRRLANRSDRERYSRPVFAEAHECLARFERSHSEIDRNQIVVLETEDAQ